MALSRTAPLLLVTVLVGSALGAEPMRISTVSMPQGLTDLYMGMPLADFLTARKGLKSNTAWVFPEDRPKGWKDPSNPRNIDPAAEDHSFKAKLRGHPVFTHAMFGLDHGRLTMVRLDAVIRDTKKIPEARRMVLSDAVRLWGRPDRTEAERAAGSPRPEDKTKRRCYLAMQLRWTKGDTTVWLTIPEDLEENAFKDDALWERLAGVSGANLMLVIEPTASAILGEKGRQGSIDRMKKDGQGHLIFQVTEDERQRLVESVNLDAIIRSVEGAKTERGAVP